MPQWRMKGQYITSCSCQPHCSCDTTGFPSPKPFCEYVVAMNIQEGNFEGVSLSGLKWATVGRFPGAVHEGNGSTEIFVDERADDSQRNALAQILAGQAGGGLFEIFASLMAETRGPHFADIEFQFDKERRRARVAVPGFFEATAEPLTVPATGEEQRVIVKLPGGFEYKEAEIAYAGVLKSTGATKFDWQKTHSALADVEHTDQGLVA